MSDLPFGFRGRDDDDGDGSSRDDGSGDGGTGAGRDSSSTGPAGFGFGGLGGLGIGGAPGTGGFDPSQLGQMFTQLGQMLSSSGGQSGPVNYDLARQLAVQQLGADTPVRSADVEAVKDAVRLAELWLDDATPLPSGVRATAAWTPRQWLEQTMPTWKRLCDPVAEQVSSAWVQGLPEEARAMAGPMIGMMGQMGGMAFGSQLGQALGQLAAEVLTSTDVGLPLGPEGTAALLPAAVTTFTEGLDRPRHEVLVYLAAREAAHQRLFGHVPWLRQRLLVTVEEYARGITVDFSGLEEMARGLDPAALQDPSAIENLLQGGAFEPKTTPAQQAALERLETLLALIEGWVDSVVTAAIGDRLPGAPALRETLRRRRASGGPAEQTFATLVGLQLRPRRLREATELWSLLAERGDADVRDRVWAHPEQLPLASDLDDPVAFVDRVLADASAVGDDTMAEFERALAAADESGTTESGTTESGTTEPHDDGHTDEGGTEPTV
ncbi:MAG: zinc-dependent metalloprotease [Mycobacteriaceae bacterium]